ncbi:MAG: carbamoyltransferase C-terminal domain-containing protein, partial [Conexivisphaera sp.]
YLRIVERVIRAAARAVGDDIASPRLIPVRHHLAHAASAYYFSGFQSAAVLVLDGQGERDATTAWMVKDGEFEELLRIDVREGSIGYLWDAVSENLGYEWTEGPGKLMGLAPYGSDFREFLERLKGAVALRDGDRPYEFRGFKGDHVRLADYVTGGKIEWNPRGEIDARAAGAARAIQEFTNELFVHMGSWIRERTGSDRLALAGGVALNARANMELHYSGLFNDIFIFPAANDAGTAIGAAAYVYEHVLGGRMRNGRLRSAYLGPEYSDEEVKGAVERSKFRAEYVGDDVGAVADLVAKGKVVAWYQGRAELGPRALGNRSIVADPTRKEYWRLVNDIKGREWWRPLAPSLLDEDKEEYFVDPVSHEFMIMMFKLKDEMCGRVPVVCHVDKTARPQTVTRDRNRTWYELIKAFKEIKGEGLVMNTSFNLAGEPLVETPQDAIRSFALGGFDAMYMQGWLIRKW